jgi:hypothetical protein
MLKFRHRAKPRRTSFVHPATLEKNNRQRQQRYRHTNREVRSWPTLHAAFCCLAAAPGNLGNVAATVEIHFGCRKSDRALTRKSLLADGFL